MQNSRVISRKKFESIEYDQGAAVKEYSEADGFSVYHLKTLYIAGTPVAFREIIDGEVTHYEYVD